MVSLRKKKSNNFKKDWVKTGLKIIAKAVQNANIISPKSTLTPIEWDVLIAILVTFATFAWMNGLAANLTAVMKSVH